MITFYPIVFCIIQYVFGFSIDKNIYVGITNATIRVNNKESSPCSIRLIYYINLKPINVDPSIYNFCKEIVLKDLLPNTHYIIFLTSYDVYDSANFTTAALTPNFNLDVEAFSFISQITFEIPIEVTSCVASLYTPRGVIHIYDGNDFNPNCLYFNFVRMTPESEYTLEYKNDFMSATVNATFKTKASIAQLNISIKYTSIDVQVITKLQEYDNCTVRIEHRNEVVPYKCEDIIECRTCNGFTVENLTPDTFYVIFYYFNSNQQLEEYLIETKSAYYDVTYDQIDVSTYYIYIYEVATSDEKTNCEIRLFDRRARCKDSCFGECRSFYIILEKNIDITFQLISNAAKYPYEYNIYTKPYTIKLTRQELDGHIVTLYFKASIYGGGECKLTIWQGSKNLPFNCSRSKCSTDCDYLYFNIEGLPIDEKIEARITNKYLNETAIFQIDLHSNVTLNETMLTTTTTANIEVFNGGTGRCNAKLYFSTNDTIVVNDCNNNDTNCISCLPYKYTNLVPNAQYRLSFTLPNKKIITRTFKTKPLVATVAYITSSTYLNFKIQTDLKLNPYDCKMHLESSSELVQSCDKTCKSCEEVTYFQLTPGVSYKFVFDTRWIDKPQEYNIKTDKSKFNITVKHENMYLGFKVNITHTSQETETCDVDVYDENMSKIFFNCNESVDCKDCKKFHVRNLNPGKLYSVIISFLTSMEIYSFKTATTELHVIQDYFQDVVNYVNVTVNAFGLSKIESICEITVDPTVAICDNCPKNCTSYSLKIIKNEIFQVSLTSPYIEFPLNITITPVTFSILLDYASYNGSILLVHLVPNLLYGGNCSIFAYSDKKNLSILCNGGTCVMDCDNLFFNITGIPDVKYIQLGVKNINLYEEAFYTVKLEKKVTLGKFISTTSTTAHIEIIGGDECCCKLKINKYYYSNYYKEICHNYEDCKNCRSFTITDLIPNQSYNIILEFNSSVSYGKFKTESLHVSLQTVTSFTSFTVTVKSPYDISQTSCSFTVYSDVENSIIASCAQDCLSCETFTLNNLTSDVTYNVEYYNSFTSETEVVSITTLKLVSEFPQIEEIVQIDEERIMMTISKQKDSRYRGTLEVYALKNASVIFEKGHVIPSSKSYFNSRDSSVFIKITPGFTYYVIRTCILVIQADCIDISQEISCVECTERRETICNKEALYGELEIAQFSVDYNEIQVKHNELSLSCHKKFQCYVVLSSILRKDVNLDNLNNPPNLLYYYADGVLFNYIASLNQTECNQNNSIYINSSSSSSKKPLVTFKGLYYTISFVICNPLACFQSQQHQRSFYIDQGATALSVALTIIGCFAGLIQYAAAIRMFIKYPIEMRKIVKREKTDRLKSVLRSITSEVEIESTDLQ